MEMGFVFQNNPQQGNATVMRSEGLYHGCPAKKLIIWQEAMSK